LAASECATTDRETEISKFTVNLVDPLGNFNAMIEQDFHIEISEALCKILAVFEMSVGERLLATMIAFELPVATNNARDETDRFACMSYENKSVLDVAC
jgi:hypothetical protein